MKVRRVALAAMVGGLSLGVVACGSHDDRSGTRAAASASATTSAPGPSSSAARPGHAGASPGSPGAPGSPGSAASTSTAEPSAVNGMVTQARGTTATVVSAGGSVPITWGPGTVIVDAVAAKSREVRVGTCVLVIPPTGASPAPKKALTAAVVRVVAASPSCPVLPGKARPGKKAAAQGGMGDSLTLVGGPGVIGTVSAVSHGGFTLKSAGQTRLRTVVVSTSATTQYRKVGDHPREAVATGRCAMVWGTEHQGSRLVATRIRMSDPVAGKCRDAGLS